MDNFESSELRDQEPIQSKNFKISISHYGQSFEIKFNPSFEGDKMGRFWGHSLLLNILVELFHGRTIVSGRDASPQPSTARTRVFGD